MNERDLTREITRCLREHGYFARTSQDAVVCNKCHNKNYPEGGLPDITCFSHPFVVEVKTFKKHQDWEKQFFPLKEITIEQRAYLTMFQEWDHKCDSYIALGSIQGRAGAEKGRRLWVIPWDMWRRYEQAVLEYRKSVPLTTFPSLVPKAMREEELDMMTVFWQWEWMWEKGNWSIPKWHPLHSDKVDLGYFYNTWEATKHELEQLPPFGES